MQDQPGGGGVDRRPPGGALETAQANTDEVMALRLTNQCLIEELEQLTKQMPSNKLGSHDHCDLDQPLFLYPRFIGLFVRLH